jgi:hypothetical protein
VESGKPNSDFRPPISSTSPPSASSIPRLSIGHLFLLTLAVGLAFACVAPEFHAVLALPAELFRGRRWITISGILGETMSAGIKLFGLAVLVRACRRHELPSLAPGHWLLIAAAPPAIFFVLHTAGEPLVERTWLGGPSLGLRVTVNVFTAIFSLGAIVVCLRGAMQCSAKRWKLCLILLGSQFLALFLNAVGRASVNLGSPLTIASLHVVAVFANLHFVVALAVVVAACIDLQAGVRRDWLHYLGLVAIVLDAGAIGIAFAPFLSQWWSNLFQFLGI